jgi:predicted RNase H-like HicB family nuclease
MTEIFFLIEELFDGGYTARAMGTDIFTQGDTLQELKANIREAVACHFEEGMTPKVIRLHFVREEIMSL